LKAPPQNAIPQLPPARRWKICSRISWAPSPTRRATSPRWGPAFIIDPSGFIVTNNHVIEDSDQITVSLQDGTQLPAKVIGRDIKDRSGAA